MKRIFTAVMIFAAGLGLVALWPNSAAATRWDVSIINFTFTPSKLHIATGDTIRWTNHDTVNHTSTSDTGVWNSGTIVPNASFSFAFTSNGTFPYHCAIHLFMKDTITVSSPTGIEDQSDATPSKFELGQNYPNPFNAQTEIEYALPYESHVRITIYNMLGQETGTLVDDDESAGIHRVVWDAASQPSGVYFYRIEAGNNTLTRKMTLAK